MILSIHPKPGHFQSEYHPFDESSLPFLAKKTLTGFILHNFHNNVNSEILKCGIEILSTPKNQIREKEVLSDSDF